MDVDETAGSSAVDDGGGFVVFLVEMEVDGDFQGLFGGDSSDHGGEGVSCGWGHGGSTGDWGKTRRITRG